MGGVFILVVLVLKVMLWCKVWLNVLSVLCVVMVFCVVWVVYLVIFGISGICVVGVR